ncbi:Low-affinity potassium transport protein [Candida viswanathii]|uniref:Potassium transport protein n=1 Tax=Candida viswanathii TaxID=5486 RepID=A0A367YAD8_9ASCO|nr:Low-affinity potassium transport protein [Candida viswanathii]
MFTKLRALYNRYTRNRRQYGYGFYLREGIHDVASKVYPYAKVVLPNFRAVHYFYIITMVILGSILIYPVKTTAYIDSLFFASGASTQAGLNPVNVNDLSLYQQIIIYLLACLTTPIFIHGSLLVVRLYYFERHFDNIKERSLMDYRMRKSATLARMATQETMSSTRMNTFNNQVLGFRRKQQEQFQDEEKGLSSSTPPSSTTQNSDNANASYPGENDVEHHSEPSDTEEELVTPTEEGAAEAADEGNDAEKIHFQEPVRPKHTRAKFGAIPKPKRKKSIDPEDMYRSINMLQQNKKNEENDSNGVHFSNVESPSKRRPFSPTSISFQLGDRPGSRSSNRHAHNNDNGDDDDDILIIKPPIEIENSDSKNPIFTRKKKHPDAPSRAKSWIASKRKKKFDPWTNRLRRQLSNTNRRKSFNAHTDTDDDYDEEEEEDASIDSENQHTEDEHGHDNDHAVTDGEDDEDDEDDDDEDEDDEDNNDNHSHDDEEYDGAPMTKSQSHLVFPSKDATGGKKFAKRSNTLDIPQRTDNNDISSTTNKKPKFVPQAKPKTKKPKRRRTTSFDLPRNRTQSIGNGSIENVDTNDSYHHISRTMSGNYLSWAPTVGRNSTFMRMTEEQKDELGGIEYRAVKLLTKIIAVYYVGFHVIPGIMLLIWIYCMPNYKRLMHEIAITPAWWAFFTALSSFNDLGFTLTPNSMSSFNSNAYVQILCSFLIVIGNTGFPIFLRFIIWVMFKFSRPLSLTKESLGFLLDHPRRCFTLLFPSVPTWWLFFILVVLNGFDLVIFCILDLHNKAFEDIDRGYRVLNGLFQAFCTRTVGFSIMDLSQLHAATQVSYLIMMYISVMPIAISVRRTNVYEEQSLGVYAKDEGRGGDNVDETRPSNYVGSHLRNQLSYDLWYICVGLFIICIAEGSKLQQQDIRLSIFPVLFEIVSAYGTVGMSMGYPDTDCSLSAKFNVVSKLVIIAMMIRGRHRGLPYAIDRAIMLPDADMKRHDRLQEEHAINRHQTMERTTTLGRVATFGGGPMDGGNNLITRVLTNIEGRLRRRRQSTYSDTSSSSGGVPTNETSDRSNDPIVSEDPHYVVTTVSHI